jgi:hypothetical protein
VHDRLEVLDGLRLLDLRDHRHLQADLGHDLADVVDVGRVAHEGQCDQVDPGPQGPPQVLRVLLRQRGHADRDTRQVEALVVADLAAHDHLGDHVGTVDLDHLDRHLAVVDQHQVTDGHIARKPLVRSRDALDVTGHVVGGDDEPRAVDELDGAAGEPPHANLRPLEVSEDADGPAGLVAGLAHVAVRHRVVLVGPVAEVQAGHVHP